MAEPASNIGLTDELKADIQRAYRAWLASRGFRPRRGQRQMIADIARGLTEDGERLCVVEAGTGTGKTVAYCLAAIPIAQALDKRIVIATATVALQEQVVLRDLPDLARHAKLDFTYTLAKGRGRYVCLQRLDDHITFNREREADLFEPPGAEDLATYRNLQSAYADGTWDGELDSWPDGMEGRVWTAVTNDRAGCGGGRCGYYQQCPFFKARRRVAEARVVVANHDLVLADASLGGGVVLPNPEETIFIFDEAHHLPEKTRERFTANVRLRASVDWLGQLSASLETMARRFDKPREVMRATERLAKETGDLGQLLTEVETMARDLPFAFRAEFGERSSVARRNHGRGVHRFPLGRVPELIAERAAPLGRAFESVTGILDELLTALEQVLDGELDWRNADQAEAWLPAISMLAGRAAGGEALFTDYASGGGSAARWATSHIFEAAEDIELTTAPLDPGEILDAKLWQTCYGAVATSATLCALGGFERFMDTAGISDARQSRIPSPFDFPRIAVFSVPPMQADPSNPSAHTEELAARLPALLALERSALVLFTSWRQFNAVVAALPDDLRERCHLQDTASKQRLLDEHRRMIDAGERSYIFGLASFAEGVDLPGDYCRHVVLAKLPFAAPDNPVDEAVAEMLESQGRNPFFEVSVPEASLRLVQASGRLIRHEDDGGRITLLDRRIVTRRYGQALLDSLPPYRLELG